MNDDTGGNRGRRRAWPRQAGALAAMAEPDFPGPTVSHGRVALLVGGGNNSDSPSPRFQSAQRTHQSLMSARLGGAP